MKTIQFLFVGLAKNPAYKELEAYYLKKISFYVRSLKIDFVKDAAHTQILQRNFKEGQEFLKKIPSRAFLILCDEGGTELDSVGFSHKLSKWHDQTDHLVFGVGGAFGFSLEVKAKAQFRLKLSSFTLPHELARVVLLEQVYRGHSLLKGEKYHHGD